MLLKMLNLRGESCTMKSVRCLMMIVNESSNTKCFNTTLLNPKPNFFQPQIQQLRGNVRVFVRARPFLPSDKVVVWCLAYILAAFLHRASFKLLFFLFFFFKLKRSLLHPLARMALSDIRMMEPILQFLQTATAVCQTHIYYYIIACHLFLLFVERCPVCTRCQSQI